MTREEFLEKSWRRYPAAKAGWVDVATHLARPSGSAVVCGRLCKSGESWQLEFAGRSMPVELGALGWLEAQIDSTPPAIEIFREGDLVALRGHLILLLAPRLASFAANPAFDFERSKNWMKFISTVREFFSRDFIEVSTPTLVPSPGTEPFLDPFVTTWTMGSRKRTYFLPTSPEFHLKKMLSSGWPRIFEIKTCFRNGEVGSHHQPEFQMLEWYRAFADLDAIVGDVEKLFERVCEVFGMKRPTIEKTTMTELFAEAFPGFALRPESNLGELRSLAKGQGIGFSEDDDFDDLFHRLFLERIDLRLQGKGIVIVRGYPPSQAALSRIGPDGFADRFEVYWRGLEIANAFHELNDPKANEARFTDDATKKLLLAKVPVPRDEDLVRAIQHGLPPSGGIALGLDRLFMAVMSLNEISATRAFPIQN